MKGLSEAHGRRHLSSYSEVLVQEKAVRYWSEVSNECQGYTFHRSLQKIYCKLPIYPQYGSRHSLQSQEGMPALRV